MADLLTMSVMKNISDLALNKKNKNSKIEVKTTSINIGKSDEAILKSILLKNKNKVNLNDLKNNNRNSKIEKNEIINQKVKNNNIELKALSSLNDKSCKKDMKIKLNDKGNKKMISLKDLSK
ncbi:MAG: hypothetical protein RR942_05665 [Romboutsia sp.]